MNDRARDERARAAVERIKAAEQEERDRKLRRYRGLSRRAVERHRDRCLSAPGGGGAGS